MLNCITTFHSTARRDYVSNPEGISSTFHFLSPIKMKKMKGFFLRDSVSFEHIFESGKHYVICNEIRAYCMGERRKLETSQREKREKYRVVSSSTVLLAFSVPS
jgi:hypothetical protein